ncbi:hypothetical protein EYF80_036375 [Liparis tanakae]|uniref:Uncharacterized protein n=1 Tax=Liparis tanakae TaxID=230148 RepID=A0A4Z2GIM4_9TELE|nr:hypothetical protein EYF80_036375 [Liparis tanakae]
MNAPPSYHLQLRQRFVSRDFLQLQLTRQVGNGGAGTSGRVPSPSLETLLKCSSMAAFSVRKKTEQSSQKNPDLGTTNS